MRLPSSKEEKKRKKYVDKERSKLDHIDNMQELKDVRELLHYEKLSLDPEIAKQDEIRLKNTLKKINTKNDKRSTH